ncbi:MAG TPA: hypothetical protein VGJ09_18700 [Bryobacteraceae bacterium]|jgi:hypothetical protein
MVRVCLQWIVGAAIIFAAPLVAGAQTFPTTAETQSAASSEPAADFSTPQAAVRSFLLAYKSQDQDGMRSALIIPQTDKEDLETLLELLNSTQRMVKAFTTAYGAAATSRQLGASPALLVEDRLKALETAEPQIQRDSATMRIASDDHAKSAGGTIRLQKTADGWKLDAASVLGLNPENPNLAASVRVARALIPVTQSVAADIERHKFISAQDAAQEFWTRSSAAIASPAGPATAAATTTAPATSPGQDQAQMQQRRNP